MASDTVQDSSEPAVLASGTLPSASPTDILSSECETFEALFRLRLKGDLASTETDSTRDISPESINEALAFISQAKQILPEEDYREFTQIIRDFRHGKINVSYVTEKVKVILDGYDDLLAGFNCFLPDESKIDLSKKEVEHIEEDVTHFLEMVKEYCKDKYEYFLEILVMFKEGRKNIAEACYEVSSILHNHPQLLGMFFSSFVVIKHDEDEPVNIDHNLHKRGEMKTQHVETRQSHDDLNEPLYGDQVTTCYKLLHKRSSMIDGEKSSILNNTCVIVPLAWNAKHGFIDPYDECLNKIEEEIFEADMTKSNLESAAKNAEGLLKSISSGDLNVRIEDSLSSKNLRCIEKLYGDVGLDIIDLLKKDARRCLPKIVNRLKQKEKEFKEFYAYQTEIWKKKRTMLKDYYAKSKQTKGKQVENLSVLNVFISQNEKQCSL